MNELKKDSPQSFSRSSKNSPSYSNENIKMWVKRNQYM